jgi:hypothetical protein
MSSPQSEAPQQDTPLTVTPSPLNMPGAAAAMNPPVQTMNPPKDMPISGKSEKAAEAAPTTESETVDLARFKAVQELARKFEKAAKDEHTDAERYRQMQQQFSAGNGDKAPDPMAEVQRLRDDLTAERTERLRAEVARTTGVPPNQIHGGDEAAMRESATEALSWATGLAQSLGKNIGVPAVAPPETVTSSTPTHQNGVTQIRSRDELRNMSSKEIMAAYNEGRLDDLKKGVTQ